MKTYLVKVSDPALRPALVAKFGKVGKPTTLINYLLITTNLPIQEIQSVPGVEAVEEDDSAEPHDTVNQTNAPEWGLPWISNTGGSYENEAMGIGVNIYVVDTGVRDSHVDFGGRVRNLFSFDDQWWSTVGDVTPTHGTSVAACAAGAEYGTAKGAGILNCRIDFRNSTILQALDRILLDHLNKPDEIQSVVNFSGSSLSRIIGDAFKRLTEFGIVVVASAGNYGEDKPRYPARAGYVVAVGAINEQEGPAWFTNRRCDVYAPGQDIRTASVFSDTSTTQISGTSFSAPYYAGILACLLEGSHKFNSQRTVNDFIFETRNQIMETGRIENFPNGSLPVRTITTKGLGGTYYSSPSSFYTDGEIREYLEANAHNPQHIADVCYDHNLSLNRLSRIADLPIGDVNQYFIDAGVRPWWFTN